jgi:hypothetical protein
MNDGTIPRSFRSIFLTHVDKVRLSAAAPAPSPSARRGHRKGRPALQEDGSVLDEVHLLGRLALVDQHVSAEAVCAPKQRRQGRRELRIKKKKKKSFIFAFREQANGC